MNSYMMGQQAAVSTFFKLGEAGWAPPKIAPVALKPVAKPWAQAPQHSPEVTSALSNLFKNYGTKAISKV